MSIVWGWLAAVFQGYVFDEKQFLLLADVRCADFLLYEMVFVYSSCRCFYVAAALRCAGFLRAATGALRVRQAAEMWAKSAERGIQWL